MSAADATARGVRNTFAATRDGRPSLLERFSPRRIPDPVRSLLYLAMCLAAVQPLRQIFTPSATRDRLVNAVVITVALVTVIGFAIRITRLPWWLHPFVCAASFAAVIFQLINGDAGFQAARTVNASTGAASGAAPAWNGYGLDAARAAVAAIGEMKRPTPALLGFGLVSIVLIGLLMLVGHILAFDLDSSFESVVPSAAILVVGSALGPGHGADAATKRSSVIFVLATGAFLLYDGACQRGALQRSGGRARPALWHLAVQFTAFAGAASLAAAASFGVIGDRYTERKETLTVAKRGTRTVTNPIVSIKPRLVELADTLMFTVNSRDENGRIVASYWRQSALDHFDGTSFSPLPRSFTGVAKGESIGIDPVNDPGRRVVFQQFRIYGLTDPWLPAAYRVQRVIDVPAGHSVAGEAVTGDVLFDTAAAPEMTYELQSALPLLTSPEAGAIAPELATEPEALDLTAGVAPAVKSLVNALIGKAGAEDADNFAKAVVLESFFRENFTYSTDVAWHGGDPLVSFLRERVGYCEQFASAFTVMARTLGIPARVAVGFTSGELQSDGLFHVTGKNAHAWPEVLLGGRGWVPFEPTPGRSRPAVVASDPQVPAATPLLPAPTVPPVAAPTFNITPPASDGTVPKIVTSVLRWAKTLLKVAIATLAATLLLGTGPMTLVLWRVRRKRHRVQAGLPPGQAQLEWSWHSLLATLRIASGVNIVTSPTVTPSEVSAIVRSRLSPSQRDVLRRLGNAVTESRFSYVGVDSRSACSTAETFDRELRSGLDRRDRLRRLVILPD